MVDINLIPAALRKHGKGNASSLTINIPKEILLNVTVGVILLMGTLHLLLGVVWLGGLGHGHGAYFFAFKGLVDLLG